MVSGNFSNFIAKMATFTYIIRISFVVSLCIQNCMKQIMLLFLQPATSGQYYGRKLTLSIGKLSFVSMVTNAQWSRGVPVLLKPIQISFGLEPALGGITKTIILHIILIL